MVFNSFAFLLFLPIVLTGSNFLRGRSRRLWLVAFSYLFYGWAVPWHCFLLIASTLLDFHIGKWLHRTQSKRIRRLFLLLSLSGNLGLLAAFKYADFLIQALNDGIHFLGYDISIARLGWALPIGISFYTFQTLSYTIDIYRRKLDPEKSFSSFALFVAFFPQLVAGPIERATHILPQINNPRQCSVDQKLSAWCRILWGLAKKVVIADWFAIYVDEAFAIPGFGGPWVFLLAINLFAFQIYLDFSAYSDIAIGLGQLLGINLRENFRWPYLSRNISEFWHRWHISLSTWLRDYLYFSLGGARDGVTRKVLNLLTVMLLGGLWHGAAYHFLAWGLWIGFLLGAHAITKPWIAKTLARWLPSHLFQILCILFTYITILCSWVLFRSKNLDQALIGFRSLGGDWSSYYFGPDPGTTQRVSIMLALAVSMHIIRGCGYLKPTASRSRPIRLSFYVAGILTFIAMFHAPEPTKFIYFQF